MRINLSAMCRGNLSTNLMIEPGDFIYVPPTRWCTPLAGTAIAGKAAWWVGINPWDALSRLFRRLEPRKISRRLGFLLARISTLVL
jgi:hypothetical protein